MSKIDDIQDQLKGVAALIELMASETDQIRWMGYGHELLVGVLEDCIEELDELNLTEKSKV